MRRSDTVVKKAFGSILAFTSILIPVRIGSENLPYMTDGEIRRGLVNVRITMMDYDVSRPWISARGDLSSVSGLVISGNRILVLANDVTNAGVIEVVKFSSYRRYPARVQRMAGEVNLAVLTVDDDSFFRDLIPMDYGRDPSPGTRLTAVKIDDLFNVHKEEVGSEGMVLTENHEGVAFPVLQFSATDEYPDGGAVLCGKKLCGFMGYSNGRTKRTEYFPPALISEIASGRSEFPSQGFEIEELIDPVLRGYYGAPETDGGALITRVIPGTSADGPLRTGDILIELAGKRVDARGFYQDPRYGPEPARLLLFRDVDRIRSTGERIAARILREGAAKEIEIVLKRYDHNTERIPRFVEGRVPYHMESGFIFTELSVPYLEKTYGQSWKSKAIELARMYDRERFGERGRTGRVVIISEVLPDETNRGYEGLKSTTVISVDGIPVTGVGQLAKALDELAEKREFCRLETGSGIPIFLNMRERVVIGDRIRDRYGLPGVQ